MFGLRFIAAFEQQSEPARFRELLICEVSFAEAKSLIPSEPLYEPLRDPLSIKLSDNAHRADTAAGAQTARTSESRLIANSSSQQTAASHAADA